MMELLDYRISSDDRQVIVNKVRRDKNGKIIKGTDKFGNAFESAGLVGYYGNLEKALNGIKKDYVLGDCTQLSNIVEYQKALEDVERAFKKEINLGENF